MARHLRGRRAPAGGAGPQTAGGLVPEAGAVGNFRSRHRHAAGRSFSVRLLPVQWFVGGGRGPRRGGPGAASCLPPPSGKYFLPPIRHENSGRSVSSHWVYTDIVTWRWTGEGGSDGGGRR